MTTLEVGRKSFRDAGALCEHLTDLMSPEACNVYDSSGRILSVLVIEEEKLSDGSTLTNIILR